MMSLALYSIVFTTKVNKSRLMFLSTLALYSLSIIPAVRHWRFIFNRFINQVYTVSQSIVRAGQAKRFFIRKINIYNGAHELTVSWRFGWQNLVAVLALQVLPMYFAWMLYFD